MNTQPNTPPIRMARTIHDAILEVMETAAWVSKTGQNSHMRYDYASEVDIISVYRPAMVEAGIYIRPLSIEIIQREMQGKNHRLLAMITYRIEGRAGIGGHIDIPVLTEGIDSQDKSAAKMYTQGLKIALLQTFLVPRGEDPDASYVEPDSDPDLILETRADRQKRIRGFMDWADQQDGGWQKVIDFAAAKNAGNPAEWASAWINKYKSMKAADNA